MIDPVRPAQAPKIGAGVTRTGAPQQEPAFQDNFVRGENQAQPSNPLQPVQPPRQQEPSPYPRPMTDDEKQDFKSWFPNLDVEKATVSAEATPQYNCISWTTGNTESWDWPPMMYPDMSPQGAFAQYYTERGFAPISDDQAAQIGHDRELVAYWEDPNGPTHGSVSGPSHGERWESKCGQAARIQHGRDELVSNVYGQIRGYWLKTTEGNRPVREIPDEVRTRLDMKLAARLINVDPKVVATFEQGYKDWQQTRKSPQVAMSSNPKDYLQGPGYQKMLSLGKEALPLWIHKMSQGDFFCQYAVQELTKPEEGAFQIKGPQPQPELKPAEVRVSEQDKANQIMVQWLDSQW